MGKGQSMTNTNTQGVAEAIIGDRTTGVPFKFGAHEARDCRHTVVIGPTGKGMSAMFEALQDELVKAGGKVKIIDKGQS
jgi:type IV secretory pathway VirB4 component